MRIRRKYWFVPALAILGILFALMHFYYKPKVHEETLILDPKEPPPPLPPSEPVTPDPVVKPTAQPAQPEQAAKPVEPQTPEAAPAPAPSNY